MKIITIKPTNYITAVRYDKDHSQITHFKYQFKASDGESYDKTVTFREMVELLNNGTHIKTAIDGKVGEDVVLRITTSANVKIKDNLNSLDEF